MTENGNVHGAAAPGYRPDIDGLRAIAVAGVVIYHAFPWAVPSGFVGVDIFFAISGYLIGGIIHREVRASRFSFVEFYTRRARRILPALLFLILVVCLLGLVLFNARELTRLGREALFAIFGVGNLHYWQSAGYFQDNTARHTLLMTWSLGVEEQFYVVFPFVMLLLARLRASMAIGAMVALSAFSFALSILAVFEAPVSAFYLLPPRAWEMGAGAALAMLHAERAGAPGSGQAPGRALAIDIASVAGLVAMVAAMFLFDHDTLFPGFAALLPVGAAVLLLHSPHGVANRMLGWAPLRFVGLVSYSWYLWHWPLMAMVRVSSDYPPSFGVMLGVVGLSFGLAVLSWRFVEQPFRKPGGNSRTVLLRYAAAMAVCGLLPLSFMVTRGLPMRLPEAAQTVVAQRTSPCLRMFESSAPVGGKCAPAGARVALLGDSHAAALEPGLVAYLARQDAGLLRVEKAACPPLSGFTSRDATRLSQAAYCGAFIKTTVARLARDPTIETVVIAGSWPSREENGRFHRFDNGVIGAQVTSEQAVREGLTRLIDQLHAAGKTVVLVGDIPRFDFDPYQHAVIGTLPLRHALAQAVGGPRHNAPDFQQESDLDPAYEPTAMLVRNIARSRPQVRYLEVRAQFCQEGQCRFMRDGRPWFADKHHLSTQGAMAIEWDAVLGGAEQ
ncbi:acyltransferase family protein [Altererythrobacter xixiisoli]|uniref:Acyltransferase family protein n=1 Tax=Croceibacterium xixiisoli TaxID=1476466 RepID=A0A6I4TT67_9SPHN|nr:acyltransferase family protein [Croceibacterium xixiisoli]MXO99365.1 acyltransferase family protein [Croceibacterium xixiisoli]